MIHIREHCLCCECKHFVNGYSGYTNSQLETTNVSWECLKKNEYCFPDMQKCEKFEDYEER